MSRNFTKHTGGRPAKWEAAGLEWLAEGEKSGGASIVRVLEVSENSLVEEALTSVAPTAATARAFGAALARTHDCADARWGGGPPSWQGDGYQGPNEHLLPLSLTPHASWGEMYADERIDPLRARCHFSKAESEIFDQLDARLRAGEFDTDDAPSRLHGDLWAGNVMWTDRGVVLIDPSAHGGHRESDLAALALFGCPYLEEIVSGYQELAPLAAGWRDRIPLHQLSMVLMHAVVFGGGYRRQAVALAARYR